MRGLVVSREVLDVALLGLGGSINEARGTSSSSEEPDELDSDEVDDLEPARERERELSTVSFLTAIQEHSI